jgi:ribose transport system permease protein
MSRVLSDYGMLIVLALLCVFLTFATWSERRPEGAAAGREVADQLLDLAKNNNKVFVIIVAKNSAIEKSFVTSLQLALQGQRGDVRVLQVIHGSPADARKSLEEYFSGKRPSLYVACSSATADWSVFDAFSDEPSFGGVIAPRVYRWSNFLTTNNLLNVANQIAVIAIIAVGMTMVVMTRGIDLSVGSLVALSAVVIARLIRDFGGGENAGFVSILLAGSAAIALCALAGLFNGLMVTLFRSPPNIPPFIVTLGMMLIASGSAYLISDGQSINRVPDSFTWLGRDATFGAIPNAVILMMVIYAAAHALMTRTTLGRYIYAVGGNPEASRLSGINVRRVLLFVYTLSGALAGLGGVMLASQLKAGAPTYGIMYELYVIAAVVVGGTSLAGGEGRVLGTLVGALIIAVIRNGMNLLGLESYTQSIVLGSVILLAVLFDRLKKQIT